MASKIPVTNPYTLKTATCLIKVESGTVYDFSDHVGELTLSPSVNTSSWTAASGKVIREVGSSSWEATLGIVQDLEAGGLARFLLANEGAKADILFTFKTESDPCKLRVTLAPTNWGGKADGSIAEATVTLPVDGKPNFNASHTLEG